MRALGEEGGGALPWARCDVLVFADMLYDVRTANALGRCAARAISQYGAAVIVAEPGRFEGAGREHFFRGFSSVGGPDGGSFEKQPIDRAALRDLGASLSWSHEDEKFVWLFSCG